MQCDGIETSFRELKYAIGLCCFHSKKVEYIMQEIYARLILYNYCELITMHVIIQQKGTKHVYQMNYTIAIHICRYFLRNDILLWSSIFVTLMANKIGGLQFGIYRNCQISSRVFHTAVAALPLTKANRSDFE